MRVRAHVRVCGCVWWWWRRGWVTNLLAPNVDPKKKRKRRGRIKQQNDRRGSAVLYALPYPLRHTRVHAWRADTCHIRTDCGQSMRSSQPARAPIIPYSSSFECRDRTCCFAALCPPHTQTAREQPQGRQGDDDTTSAEEMVL